MNLGYIDAGSGSLLLQAILGGAAGIAVAFKAWRVRITGDQAILEDEGDQEAATVTEAERGFSLIEIAVVGSILAVLIIIAIPTFLGQREGAQDGAAQANLRNAAYAAAGPCLRNQDPQALADCLTDAEPDLTYTPGASTGATTISFDIDSRTVAVLSDSGTCWAGRAQGRSLAYAGGEVEACSAAELDPSSITGDSFGDASQLTTQP